MRRILCYGDSNTWGYIAGTGERYPENVRWTGVVQRELGAEYAVIEEGLNARTSVYDHPRAIGRKGSDYLVPCLITHKPLDLVVMMLGTNDLQWTDAYGAAEGSRMLVKMIKHYSYFEESSWIFADGMGKSRILLVAPIRVHPIADEIDPIKRRHNYVKESELFSELYEKVARETGCSFLDAAEYAEPSTVDALHMTRESHERLGVAIAQKIREIFAE